MMFIHILRHGSTLCGKTVPEDWPENHRWVSFEDPEALSKANCDGCLSGPKQPKNLEIERRFLVQLDKLSDNLPKGRLISQGYLSIDPVVRVRISGEKAWITIKGPGLIEREEFEYEIEWQDAEDMMKLCRHMIIKTRRQVKYGAHVWDVDEFHGPLQGLWVAEIELKSKYEGYEPPPWVGREVSDDRRFTNASLSRSDKIPVMS